MKKSLLLLSSFLLITSCTSSPAETSSSEGNNESQTSSSITSKQSTSENESKDSNNSRSSEEKEFESVTFTSASYVYDGKTHSLTVAGAPSDATVKYTEANSYIDAGSYIIHATVEKDGYKTLSLQATLTIQKATMSSLSLNNANMSVKYDGTDHIGDMTVVGAPEGTNTKKTVTNSNGQVVTSCIDIGTYQISIEATNKNFNTVTLNGKLTIYADKTEMPIFSIGSKIYFSNGLDSKNLYSYDTSLTNENLAYANYDTVKQYLPYGDGVIFLSKSFLFNAIKRINSSGSITTLYTGSANYIATDGSSTIYYSVNGLTASQSGIYKLVVDETNGTSEPTQIFAGKTYDLTYLNGNLYFADGSNSKYLSSISANATGIISSSTLVYKEAIYNMIASGGKLYFNVNNLSGNYIASYNPSTNKFGKLTTSAGDYLTVVGNELYFANVDVLNSALYGKGIYKVKTDGTDSTSAGTKVIATDYSINSIYYADNTLYFIDAGNLHLYSYKNGAIADLMSGFEPPEHAYANKGGQQVGLNGKIYYLNMQRGKTLCVYDPLKQTNLQLTAEKVDNFTVIGDYIYINMVTYFVNNDLYRFNYKLSEGLEKVSTDAATEIVGDDNYIYYAKDNVAGVATSIERIDLKNNFAQKQIYSKGVSNLRLYNNVLYAVDGSEIVTFNTNNLPADVKNPTSTLSGPKHVDFFEIDEGYVYYSYTNGISNSLRRFALSNPSSEFKLAEKSVDPVEIQIIDDFVYFLSDTAISSADGLYKVTKNQTTENTHSLVLARSTLQDIEIYNGYLYYLDSGWGSLVGTSHVCQQDMSDLTKNPINIDTLGF